jgi:4-diphosphocytidyl-2-C-methyl-D-erythritol kinase
MSTLRVTAPAKINLSLRVLGKRDDGFHEVDTLMVKLPGLCDELEFREATKFSFTCDDPSVPTGEDNLVVRALRAFEKVSGKKCRYEVLLRKRIPHGAGLGGGSSDAAATLLALNQLHGGVLGKGALEGISAALGSDVPFFLLPGAGRCSGRGDLTEAAASPPPLRVVLLKPAFGVATPDAYRRWADAVELPCLRYSEQNLDGLILVNDLERPVFGKYRFLAELKQWLLERRESAGALMCGSGSTMFAVLHIDADPQQLISAARVELDPHLWAWHGITQDAINVQVPQEAGFSLESTRTRR